MVEQKKKILIVDDSEMNREILISMLEDEYDIIEAEDGQQAVCIMTENHKDLSLLLLDMNMPVMNGYEVLRVMKERLWLDRIPVICISADSSDDTIGKAYELGVSDYFARPFDAAVVLRRVHNTIALHDKSMGNFQDAIGMLSAFYYLILKVNLTTDSYLILKDGVEDQEKYFNEQTSFYDRVYSFIEKEHIYQDDEKDYLEFCSLQRLREAFAGGSKQESIRYRRKVGNEFKWVSVTMICSEEYQPDNQVVMLYVKDINDDYLKQLDEVMRKTTDSLGTVTVNVSEGYCVSCAVKDKSMDMAGEKERLNSYVRRLSQYAIGWEDRIKAEELFSQESLLQSFENGRTNVSLETAVQGDDDEKIRMFRVAIEMARNSVTQEIEGVMYFLDITESYLAEKIPQLLYQKSFEKIALIDARRKLINIESTEEFNAYRYLNTKINYDVYVHDIIGATVPPQERERLTRYMDLDHICEELDLNGRYSYTIHQISEDGEKRLKEFNCMYLFKELGIILAVTEDITELSSKDVLTGGYNMQGFVHEAENIFRHCKDRTDYVVLYFNVRNFKAVNELFGIDNGDKVLRMIHKHLKESRLKPCITARVEADQFTCLIRKENLDLEVLSGLCEWNFAHDGKMMNILCGCGIFYVEDKPMSINGMIDRAKIAKRYIKDEYVKPYNIYDTTMKSDYINRAELTGELKNGLAQEQFKVYYQPVIDAKTEKIVSAEALIRWIHPQRGFVSPAVFIPALEESGHISELDFYVTKKVFAFEKERYNQGKKIVPVSINLSWMDFYDETMMSWIDQNVGEYQKLGIKSRFEITETSFEAMKQNRNNILEALQAKGAMTLLDDFGSGYSSYGVLQDYNFDILKIDMSLVRQIETNPKSRSILKSIIEMAHELGMKLVAEGAETEEQVAFLKENDCDYIQGYYYSKPLPEEEFIEFMETH
ncbi:two-component system response regulator [Dorea sp.]